MILMIIADTFEADDDVGLFEPFFHARVAAFIFGGQRCRGGIRRKIAEAFFCLIDNARMFDSTGRADDGRGTAVMCV